jgi:uncharacterized protein YkwD
VNRRKIGVRARILLLCLAPLSLVPVCAWGQPVAPDLAAAARQAVAATNEFRREHDLGPLASDAALAASAQEFAAYMARTGNYGHEADGRTPAERAKAHGYDYCSIAENIGWLSSRRAFLTAQLARGFVEGWKHSPEHRKNMLRPEVTESGVAIARAESGRYYAVQMLGRPASLGVRFQIENRAGAAVRYELDGREFMLAPRVTRTHKRCADAALAFRWPQGGGPSVRARDGDRLSIVRSSSGELAVRRD